MDTKHTAGPWETQAVVREGSEPGVSIVGADLGGLVGWALPWPTEIDSGDFSRVEANACVMAAGPEMLEAGQDLLKLIEAMTNGGTAWQIAKMRAAIAKATGAA